MIIRRGVERVHNWSKVGREVCCFLHSFSQLVIGFRAGVEKTHQEGIREHQRSSHACLGNMTMLSCLFSKYEDKFFFACLEYRKWVFVPPFRCWQQVSRFFEAKVNVP